MPKSDLTPEEKKAKRREYEHRPEVIARRRALRNLKYHSDSAVKDYQREYVKRPHAQSYRKTSKAKYYQKNKELISEKQHEYYLNNKQRWAERQAKRSGTLEYRIMKHAAGKRYYEKHKVREIAKRIAKHRAQRMQLFHILGGAHCVNLKCLVPAGCLDDRCLTFDHIKGGGTQSRLRFGHNRAEIAYYILHPDEAKRDLQVLCMNCQLIKKIENKEFNFKKKKKGEDGGFIATSS